MQVNHFTPVLLQREFKQSLGIVLGIDMSSLSYICSMVHWYQLFAFVSRVAGVGRVEAPCQYFTLFIVFAFARPGGKGAVANKWCKLLTEQGLQEGACTSIAIVSLLEWLIRRKPLASLAGQLLVHAGLLTEKAMVAEMRSGSQVVHALVSSLLHILLLTWLLGRLF